jgi:small subunit ribosomal protein S1
MSWTRTVRHPSKVVSIGEDIEAVVLKVDPNDEKISLGMKQIEEDPWLGLPVKYPTGTKLAGTVRNLTSFGAFVEIEPGIDGLVHVSDLSWTKRVEHPSEVVHKGEELEVMVLDVDAENKRISLGIKQLQDDPWPAIADRLAPGVELDGKIARLQEKGIVVDLGDDIESFVPVSHSGVDDAARLEEYYSAGDAVSLRVLESDAANRRIVLEVSEPPERKSQEEIDAARAAALEAAEAAALAASAAEADDDEPIRRLRPKVEEAPEDSAEAKSEGNAPTTAADAAAEVVGAAVEPDDEAEEAPEAEAEEPAAEEPAAEAEKAAPEAEAEEVSEVAEVSDTEAEAAPEAEADEASEAEAEKKD